MKRYHSSPVRGGRDHPGIQASPPRQASPIAGQTSITASRLKEMKVHAQAMMASCQQARRRRDRACPREDDGRSVGRSLLAEPFPTSSHPPSKWPSAFEAFLGRLGPARFRNEPCWKCAAAGAWAGAGATALVGRGRMQVLPPERSSIPADGRLPQPVGGSYSSLRDGSGPTRRVVFFKVVFVGDVESSIGTSGQPWLHLSRLNCCAVQDCVLFGLFQWPCYVSMASSHATCQLLLLSSAPAERG